MTKQELIAMVGSEERAEYTLQMILASIKPSFVESIIKAESNELDAQIQQLIDEDYIYECNGDLHVNWAAPDTQKSLKADSLIYNKHRIDCMRAVH